MSLDTTAMHIGYSVMAGTALGIGGTVVAAHFPRQTARLLTEATVGAVKLQVKTKLFYENYVAPTLDGIKEMFFGPSGPYLEDRVLVIKDGQIIAATTSPNMLSLFSLDYTGYDMVLYNFGDGESSPMIRFDKAENVNDNFKMSDHKFINVTLNVGDDEYTLNLCEPENYYVAGNRILDHDFVKWMALNRLGMKELPGDYKITVIDGNADQLTLRINDAILMQEDGYDVLERVGDDSSDSAVDVEEETPEETTSKEVEKVNDKSEGGWWRLFQSKKK